MDPTTPMRISPVSATQRQASPAITVMEEEFLKMNTRLDKLDKLDGISADIGEIKTKFEEMNVTLGKILAALERLEGKKLNVAETEENVLRGLHDLIKQTETYII